MEALKIRFPNGRGKLTVIPGQIIRLQAVDNYTRVFFSDHKPLLMARVLRSYDKLLSPLGFIRTHRSHLVNPDYVDQILTKKIILMTDASEVEVSRRRVSLVAKHFGLTRSKEVIHLTGIEF